MAVFTAKAIIVHQGERGGLSRGLGTETVVRSLGYTILLTGHVPR